MLKELIVLMSVKLNLFLKSIRRLTACNVFHSEEVNRFFAAACDANSIIRGTELLKGNQIR